MKVADYIIKRLHEDFDIQDFFVLYGSANGHLIDAFSRVESANYIATMHEQGAGFAAEGWTKVTNKPGCVIVTSGPGAQNVITSIANCWFDSVPMIFLTGNISTKYMRPQSRSTRTRSLSRRPSVVI
jgi:acetolactate synthase-1/2/3 large subunit